MSENDLRRRLKIEYYQLKASRDRLMAGGWYGDWTHEFNEMERQRRDALKASIDEIMKKLGYETWTDSDVNAELRKKQSR